MLAELKALKPVDIHEKIDQKLVRAILKSKQKWDGVFVGVIN